jgi:hypothetical protein
MNNCRKNLVREFRTCSTSFVLSLFAAAAMNLPFTHTFVDFLLCAEQKEISKSDDHASDDDDSVDYDSLKCTQNSLVGIRQTVFPSQ